MEIISLSLEKKVQNLTEIEEKLEKIHKQKNDMQKIKERVELFIFKTNLACMCADGGLTIVSKNTMINFCDYSIRITRNGKLNDVLYEMEKQL